MIEMNMTYQQASSLRRLYFVRTGFQVFWAASVLVSVATQPMLAAILLVVYPLWDVACTVYDLRTSALDGSTRRSQTVNAVLGIVAAAGIAATTVAHPPYAIAIFGAWAFGAGALQLLAGLLRRQQVGGQWAMILSGVQSTLAGATQAIGGLHGTVHADRLAPYAIFGAFYFLISAVLLRRKLMQSHPPSARAVFP